MRMNELLDTSTPEVVVKALAVTGPVLHEGVVFRAEVDMSVEPFLEDDPATPGKKRLAPWRNDAAEASRRLGIPQACDVEVPNAG